MCNTVVSNTKNSMLCILHNKYFLVCVQIQEEEEPQAGLYACHSSPFNQISSALSILLTGLSRQNSETAPKISAPAIKYLV